MTALAHGVPLLFPPLFGDQPMVSATIERAGAGRALPREAEPAEIRAAVEDLLATPAYRQAARRLATIIKAQDGASLGADELESLLTCRDRESVKL